MTNHRDKRVIVYGLLCLLILAPFFFISYGYANRVANAAAYVPSIVFEWERHIPLWPWTIVPYWSIDLFYGLSLLMCRTKFELRQHFLRLIAAQIIAVSFFLLFPLKFSFERPELSGVFALWFDVLMGFDKPFNQAPSLHIILLVILWDFYQRRVSGIWRLIVHVLSALIGLSVLTTWQHHFFDIPTGLIVGALCLWLFPIHETQVERTKLIRSPKTLKNYTLALAYTLGCAFFTCLGYSLGPTGWWLFYPAFSLLLVATAYLLNRADFFQKNPSGSLSIAAYLLYAPYLGLAFINSRLWTQKHPQNALVANFCGGGIYLGRLPTQATARSFDALFDCCAELPAPDSAVKGHFYSLDLLPLSIEQLHEAATRLNQVVTTLKSEDCSFKLLIFCALGYSRSAAVLAAWLVTYQRMNASQAVKLIQTSRPSVRLNPSQLRTLEKLTHE